MPEKSGLATGDSGFNAIDVLFHPSSRTSPGACPLKPLSEAELDAAGIGRALVSQCKKWSCERQWMCVDTRLEDVLRYTHSSPRFAGLAGYNPFDIAESLREIELAVSAHGFRGIYLHAASFKLPLADARIYPLFAKAAELAVPALIQLPLALGLHPVLQSLTADFPDLALVLAQPSPELDGLASIAADCENIFFALDPPALKHLLGPGLSETAHFELLEYRCMWGSNGVDWPKALHAADSLPAPLRQHFLHDNAGRLFALDQPPASRAPRSAVTEIAAAER